jgi:ubiquinone/menaquinone biosynthesis C-methylase UbiE
MRKVQFTAVFWTLVLATPLTALALLLMAYTTENLTQIATAIANFSRETTAGGRGWVLEFAQRWPEVAGMVIGQLVLLTIFLLVRQGKKAEEKSNNH